MAFASESAGTVLSWNIHNIGKYDAVLLQETHIGKINADWNYITAVLPEKYTFKKTGRSAAKREKMTGYRQHK